MKDKMQKQLKTDEIVDRHEYKNHCGDNDKSKQLMYSSCSDA